MNPPLPLPTDARMRLPREPYPGLRPFLDFEAALLFGRERQVREIIERLASTHFVAVLGGSGSGKSSLIHAGVTPELRSFGIPGAGDLWLPLVCTPGTNVAAADRAARRHTPVTRLARRFAALLKGRGSDEKDAERLAHIAEAFREEAGFARLLDAYAGELNVPPGPDPAQARVMFVIDQFEEIFHPTNQGVDDARVLVERVLDHFFNPHPRCYVVLTMRSEHLNDCAAYLELPDAINKSSFLVRRLDLDELREAIVGPAQRFLRLVSRSAGGGAQALPEQVHFEPAVIERLLRDVSAITQDPDHLPLLQHLLARLWEAALEREEMDMPVPAFITEIDLVRAVNGGTGGPGAARGGSAPGGDDEPLDPTINTLRECVNNWPEKIYLWQDADRKRLLDALFRRLAFKDPNTGLYSQQRLDVDEAASVLGPGKSRHDLKELVAEGFLGSVDYLFWDDEDPSRVTLKVSHESFIRGWARFRALIDAESNRFEEFIGVMRKAAEWVEHGREEDYLLETGEMRRLRESDFQRHLADPWQRATWERFLALDRDGKRLALHARELARFIGISDQRIRDRTTRDLRRRQARVWAMSAFTLLGLLPTALFTVLIQTPTMRRAELLFDAGNRANGTTLLQTYAQFGATHATLDSLLLAAERVDAARSGGGGVPLAATSEFLVDKLDGIAPVRRQGEFLDGVLAQSEPLVNGKLRQLLTQALWRSAPPEPEGFVDAPLVIDAVCGRALLGAGGGGVVEALKGRLHVSNPGARGDRDARASGDGRALRDRRNPIRRALFVPERAAGDRSLQLISATWNAAERQCVLGPSVLSLPAALDPHAVFDAGLRYLFYTLYTGEAGGTEAPTLIVQEIDWYWGRFGQIRALHRQTLTALTDPRAVAHVRAAAGPPRAAAVRTWREEGGRGLEVDTVMWRVVSAQARPLRAEARAPAFEPLLAVAPDSPCGQLAASAPPAPGFTSTAWQAGENCLVTMRGPIGFDAATDAPADSEIEANEPPREEVRVALYNRPTRAALQRMAENPPAPIASIAPYARIAGSNEDTLQWAIGRSGAGTDLGGWLVLTRTAADGRTSVIGAPLDTCALLNLGRQIQADNPAPVRSTVTASGKAVRSVSGSASAPSVPSTTCR